MNKPTMLTIGAILSGWLLLGTPGLDRLKLPDLTPSSPTAPVVAPPSAELQSKVAPVTAVLKGHGREAVLLAGYFRDFATVVEKQPGICSTAGRLQSHHRQATGMYFPFVAGPGAVPGLVSAIDTAMADMLGLEDAALEPAKAKAALEALAFACGEAI